MATWIKVCGITNASDARVAIDTGADAIGVVFAPSPRRVPVPQAQEITAAVAGAIPVIGVFVDTPVQEMCEVRSHAPLDVVQLHGDETPTCCQRLGSAILKRIRIAEGDSPDSLAERISAYSRSDDGRCADIGDLFSWGAQWIGGCGPQPIAILLDPGAGSGKTFDWRVAASLPDSVRSGLVISGGLTPENVAEAIRTIRPAGVDVSSGVERAPGVKDEAKLRAFVAAVRGADDGVA